MLEGRLGLGHRFALAVLAAIGVALVGLAPAFALAIAPLLCLVFALICGRTPGERVLAELRERLAAPRRARSALAGASILPLVTVRAGIRNAFALAMRPPPSPAFLR